MRKSFLQKLSLTLVMIFIITIVFFLTGCSSKNCNLTMISVLPADDTYHKNQTFLVLQDGDGIYDFYVVDLTIADTDADILAQIESLKPGEEYRFRLGNAPANAQNFTYYIYSVSPKK